MVDSSLLVESMIMRFPVTGVANAARRKVTYFPMSFFERRAKKKHTISANIRKIKTADKVTLIQHLPIMDFNNFSMRKIKSHLHVLYFLLIIKALFFRALRL